MIGLFIGSFNPPTIAHLNICLKLRKKYKKIVFVPVNSKDKNLVSLRRRCEMLRILIGNNSFLTIDNIMDNYSYFDYRILDILKEKYQNIELIIGSDILLHLPNFNQCEYLVKNFKYVVITRDNIDADKIIHKYFSQYKDNFMIYEYLFDCSSTKARELILNNKSTKGILDDKIDFYIKENHLYF